MQFSHRTIGVTSQTTHSSAGGLCNVSPLTALCLFFPFFSSFFPLSIKYLYNKGPNPLLCSVHLPGAVSFELLLFIFGADDIKRATSHILEDL